VRHLTPASPSVPSDACRALQQVWPPGGGNLATMIQKPLAVALSVGLFACLTHAPVLAADYGSAYRYAPSGPAQGSYPPPASTRAQGYAPNYDVRGYGPQDYAPGSYAERPAGQGGTAPTPWVYAPDGRSHGGAVTGYQFRQRPEDKHVERDSSPRYRPDSELSRRARGSWSPSGEMWSAPGAQGPAVIFRPWESGGQKAADTAERSPAYPAWTDPALRSPPWPGGGPGYYPPPY